MSNSEIRNELKKISKSANKDNIGLCFYKVGELIKDKKLTPATARYVKLVRANIGKSRNRKPKIQKLSTGELEISKYLMRNKIRYKGEVEFDDLINPNTKYKLRMDFYIPSKNVCIEFDGKQHFEYSEDFDKGDVTKFEKRQYLDSIKNQYCIDKGIKLIRISYLEISKVKEILDKEFI